MESKKILNLSVLCDSAVINYNVHYRI